MLIYQSENVVIISSNNLLREKKPLVTKNVTSFLNSAVNSYLLELN